MTKQVAGVLWVEKRTARRYGTALEVLFIYQGRLTRATGLDISMTGMRIASEIDMESGVQLQVHFAPSGNAQMHQLTGNIAWSRPSGEIAGVFEIGLEFSTLPADTNEELARLVKEISGQDEADDLPLVEDEHVMTMSEGTSSTVQAQVAFSASAGSLLGTPDRTPLGVETPVADGDWTVSHHLDNAIAEDSLARERNRILATTLMKEAKAAQEAGQGQQAVEMLRQATVLVPDSAETCEELAAALYLTGEVTESAQLFDRALRLRVEEEHRGG